MAVDPINIAILVFSAIMAIAAILTFLSSRKQTEVLRKSSKKQTELLRRTLYGEIYKNPPLDRVGFYKPMPQYESDVGHDKRVRYSGKVEGDNWIFEQVTLPKKETLTLAFTFRTKKKQSLKHVQFGCRPKRGREPRVLSTARWWAARKVRPLPSAAYSDLDGYYHIEYPTPRKLGAKFPLATGFKLETKDVGEYDFDVEIYSTEAKESFKKTLKVIVR